MNTTHEFLYQIIHAIRTYSVGLTLHLSYVLTTAHCKNSHSSLLLQTSLGLQRVIENEIEIEICDFFMIQ